MKAIKEILSYKELLKNNVKKDIRGKYKGSFLGVLWSFVNPLLMVLVYALVFPYIMRIKQDNYLIYLISAIIPWNYFTTTVTQGTVTVLNNANVIKKVYFPREILPISTATSALVNFLISCIIILLFVIFGGVGISWVLIFLPFIALIQYIISLSIIFILSGVEIYVKDIEYIVNFVIMMLFYLTPILYSIDMIPAKLQWIIKLNPMSHLINAYRDIFLYHNIPNMKNLSILLAIGLVLLVITYKLFKKMEKGFAEEV